MSTANPDAELVARGERFEKFLLEYMDAWLEWAPLMRGEALPSHAFHHGAFEFRDDGEASRSLFDAVAGMTGLTPLVRELEARLAADVELKGADA